MVNPLGQSAPHEVKITGPLGFPLVRGLNKLLQAVAVACGRAGDRFWRGRGHSSWSSGGPQPPAAGDRREKTPVPAGELCYLRACSRTFPTVSLERSVDFIGSPETDRMTQGSEACALNPGCEMWGAAKAQSGRQVGATHGAWGWGAPPL